MARFNSQPLFDRPIDIYRYKKRRLINREILLSLFISLYVVIKTKPVNFYIYSTLITGNILVFRSSVATTASTSTFIEATFVEATTTTSAASATTTIAATAATTSATATETTAAT